MCDGHYATVAFVPILMYNAITSSRRPSHLINGLPPL